METKLLALAMMMSATAMAGAHKLSIDGIPVDKTVATITFEGDKAILTFGDNTSSTHDLESVKLDFNSTSSLTDLRIGTLSVTVGSSIFVSGVDEGTLMLVYDMRGVQVKSQRADGSECEVSLEGLDAGVYIFRAGNEVVKFVKR